MYRSGVRSACSVLLFPGKYVLLCPSDIDIN